MKRRGWLAAGIAGVLMAGLAIGCGTPKTSVTQVWQAPSPETPRMKTMLVFGVRVDEPNRRVLEDAFAADLSRHGVRAAQSYVLFPGQLPPIDQARALVNENHYEGILVLTLRGVHEEQHFVPSNYGGGFWNGYYGGWGYGPGPGYYGGYGGYGAGGYIVTDKTVVFEATLWDLRAEDKLVWTARTETINPTAGNFAPSLTRGVNPALVRSGFLPAPMRKEE